MTPLTNGQVEGDQQQLQAMKNLKNILFTKNRSKIFVNAVTSSLLAFLAVFILKKVHLIRNKGRYWGIIISVVLFLISQFANKSKRSSKGGNNNSNKKPQIKNTSQNGF